MTRGRVGTAIDVLLALLVVVLLLGLLFTCWVFGVRLEEIEARDD